MRLSQMLIHGAAAAALAPIVLAASAQPPAGDGARRPPAEALAACRSAVAGSDCSFTGPRGAQKGTCWAPEGKPLACKPKAPPEGASHPKSPTK